MRTMRQRKRHFLRGRRQVFTLESLERRLLLNGSAGRYFDVDLSDFIREGYAEPDPFFADPAGITEINEGIAFDDFADGSWIFDQENDFRLSSDDIESTYIEEFVGPAVPAPATGSTQILYLEFDGARVYSRGGDFWLGSSYIDVPAFDLSLFNWEGREQEAIDYVTQFVQEDYAAYNITVTTIEPAGEEYTTLYVGGSNDWFQPGSGVIGVATYDIGNTDYSNYGFAFVEELSIYYNYSGGELINFSEYLANLVSHEAGHTFGTNHVDDPSAIMNPYLALSPRRTMWGSGNIPGSSYEQDTQSLLGENLGWLYGEDDYGDSISAAETTNQNTVIEGILERRDDVDAFTFTATATGSIELSISTTDFANLDSYLTVYRTSDQAVIAENDDYEGDSDSAITFDGVAGEEYTIYVSSYDSNSSGTYVLALDPAPEVPSPDITITDSLGSEDDLILDFGSITVDTFESATFTISNDGTADLVVSELSVDSVYELDLVSLPGDSGDDLVMAPGSEQIIEITFHPDALESFPASVTIVSNDGDEGLITLLVTGMGNPPQPNIYVPETMDLGEVIRNGTISDTLMIYNNGQEDLVLSYVDVSSPFDLGAGLGAPTVTITPGSYFELEVSVTPTQRGPITGQANILSNDPDESVISVDLFVQSRAGLLLVEDSAADPDDSHIDFGSVYVDTTAENTLTLTNSGDADLTITGLEADAGFSLSMEMDQLWSGDDVVLASGASMFFDVIYSPEEIESAEGIVTIYTDDTEIPENYVQLEAAGIGGILQVTELDGINDEAIHYDNIEAGLSYWVNPWQLTNNGNASITVFFNMTDNTDIQLLSPESVTLLPGTSYTVNVLIETNLACLVTDTLTLAANDLDSTYEELSLSADVSALIGSGANYQFTDHSGDLVTLSLKGASWARVKIGTEEEPDIRSIELLSGTADDTLSIKVKGEGNTSLGALTGSGNLKALLGPWVDLTGAGIDLAGSLQHLSLNDVADSADIYFAAAEPVKVSLGVVGESTIDIAGSVQKLAAVSMAHSYLEADFIRQLSILEDLDAQINVTVSNLEKLMVRNGDITGAVSVDGAIGNIAVRQGDLNGDIIAEGDIARIQALGGTISGTLKGQAIDKIAAFNLDGVDIVALTSMDSIRVKNNMTNSMVTVGYDGLLQPDQSAASSFATDAYLKSLKVKGTFAASTVAVGVAPDSQGSYMNGTANTISGIIGKVTINQVNTNNQSDPFGLVAQNDINKLRVNRETITGGYQMHDFVVTVLNQ